MCYMILIDFLCRNISHGRNVLGVDWDNESTDEMVVLLSQLKQKPNDYINVTIELDDMDITPAEAKAHIMMR